MLNPFPQRDCDLTLVPCRRHAPSGNQSPVSLYDWCLNFCSGLSFPSQTRPPTPQTLTPFWALPGPALFLRTSLFILTVRKQGWLFKPAQ